jgi:DNA repair exonuclease SbcCD ATPase subunit
MRLDFKKIEIHSFMSFEDEVFEFDARKGMVLVRGRNNDLPDEVNGSGKSNLWGALTYVLFGQVQDRIKKNENIVNRFVADRDMRVALTLYADGKPYKVVRGLNKGKTSYLELYSGDDDVTKSTIAETQDFLEKEIIRCDLSIFLRTILLTSKQTYNFYELKKADKKEFVEKLFDISVFGDMYQAIHRDTLDCDKAILARQNKLLVLNRSNEDYSARMAQYDADRKKKLSDLDKTISNTKCSYEKLKASGITINAEEKAKLESAAEKINTAKRKLNSSAADVNTQLSKIELAIHKLNSSKESKQAAIDKQSSIMAKLCEDCRPVFAEHCGIAGYGKEISEINEKLAKLASASTAELSKKSEISDKLKKLDEKLELVENKITELTSEYNKASRELMLLESRINSMETDRKKTETETNPYAELYNNNIKNIETENAALDAETEKCRYLKFAENVVSQETLRKFIISDLIGLLNNKIKTYLTKLGSKYTVVFDSDMDYEFITEGGVYEFGNFSAGEQMRIMMATSFAFRDFMSIRNGLNANILVLDEYFDSAISSSCVERVLSLLKEYAEDCNQTIYCISHRSEVSTESFDSVMEIQKTNNISRILYIG